MQSAHVESPTADAYLPTAHIAHTVKPVTAANFPVAHAVQSVKPLALLYVPVTQPMHPLEDAAVFIVPGAQTVHKVRPEDAVNLPLEHKLQFTVCSLSVYVPGAHDWYAEAPVDGTYVPTGDL